MTTPDAEKGEPRPDISGLLRERLIESLIADGTLSGDVEVVADEMIALARERGRAMREKRVLPPERTRPDSPPHRN